MKIDLIELPFIMAADNSFTVGDLAVNNSSTTGDLAASTFTTGKLATAFVKLAYFDS